MRRNLYSFAVLAAFSVVALPVLAGGAGCGGGKSNDSGGEPGKSVYQGPGFGDDETGGVAYISDDVLVRPGDQNNGKFGRVTGTLTASSREGDGWKYDLFSFTAIESGDRLIELESRDFDPVIAIFRVYPDGFWEFLGLDDDSGVGSNARFTVKADRNANYVASVTPYTRGETGAYTLSLSPGLTYAATRKTPDYPFARPHQLGRGTVK